MESNLNLINNSNIIQDNKIEISKGYIKTENDFKKVFKEQYNMEVEDYINVTFLSIVKNYLSPAETNNIFVNLKNNFYNLNYINL